MNRREFWGMASVGLLAAGVVTTRVLTKGSGGADPAGNFRVQLTDAQWKARLTPESYQVLRQKVTEFPGTSSLVNEHRKGIFACAGCDTARRWPQAHRAALLHERRCPCISSGKCLNSRIGSHP